MMAYVVGIAGPSCSGKSLIAKELATIYSQHSPCILSLDSYYHDLSELHPSDRARRNYDTPEAIDAQLLKSQLATLLTGGEIERPVYDYKTHSRSPVTEHIGPTRLILVEGLFALYWEEIRRLLNTGVFVTLPAELALARRLERDVRERGRSFNSVLMQYKSTVKPMNARYVLPTTAHADVVVSGAQPVAESIALVRRHIDSHFSSDAAMLIERRPD